MSAEYTIYFVTKVVICDDCYGSSINIKYHDVDLKAPYPDDFDCPACNGKGSIESSVPLEDALRELGFGLTPRAADETVRICLRCGTTNTKESVDCYQCGNRLAANA